MSEKVVRWVDANVLLRFLTGDPPELARRASRVLEKAERDSVPLRVHSVTVAETVSVLRSFYGYSKDDISSALIPLLDRPSLRVDGTRAVLWALESMAGDSVDFVDALLAETARPRGEGVVSFDRDFRRLDVARSEPD